MRTATITRKTAETDITVELNLDGTGVYDNQTGVGFFDHMLDQLARHSLIDMTVRATGDLQGLTIGILDNTKPNAGVLLAAAADELCRRTGARVVRTDTKNAALPAKDQVLDGMIREVQVVLTGSAD